jgi:hypothetical protein
MASSVFSAQSLKGYWDTTVNGVKSLPSALSDLASRVGVAVAEALKAIKEAFSRTVTRVHDYFYPAPVNRDPQPAAALPAVAPPQAPPPVQVASWWSWVPYFGR